MKAPANKKNSLAETCKHRFQNYFLGFVQTEKSLLRKQNVLR